MLSSTTVPMVDEKKLTQPCVLVSYIVFIGIAVGMYWFIAEEEFSAIHTMGEIFECGALVTLAMQVVLSGSTAGISANSLVLEAVALCCKLSSTLWLDGYLPNDASG